MIKDRQVIQLPSIEEFKMSIDLINSIANGDYVTANRLFEERLSDIQEKKLYEAKRMFAADLNEVLGGKTRAQAEKEIRARGMTPRRASDVYPDPRDIKISKIGEKKPKSDISAARISSKKKSTEPSYSGMSSFARRAELEKNRQAKISSENPLRASRLMTRSEIGKTILKKVGGGVLGALSDIGSHLEE